MHPMSGDPAHAGQHVALSNLAHRVVGVLLAAVSIAAVLGVVGVLGGGWRYLWPALLIAVGLFVPSFVLWAAREHQVPPAVVLTDPQQRQHFLLSALLLLGGLGEALGRGGVLPGVMGLLWPAVLIVIGYLFTVHTQHGTTPAVQRAVRAHRWLGGTLLLSGAARLIEIVQGGKDGAGSLVWIILLFAAAVQFMIYHEPEGAYTPAERHGHH